MASRKVQIHIGMDVGFLISTGWGSDRNSEFEIQLQFDQRRLSFYRDQQIPRMKENEKLMIFKQAIIFENNSEDIHIL